MSIDTRLSDFIKRCDEVGRRRNLTRKTLSFKLFDDGKRLDALASGGSDIGIGRLARAERALDTLEGVGDQTQAVA